MKRQVIDPTNGETIEIDVVESPQRDPNYKFDLRAQVYDAKTGELIINQPYLIHKDKDHGWVYERPTGVYQSLNGQLVKDFRPTTQVESIQKTESHKIQAKA